MIIRKVRSCFVEFLLKLALILCGNLINVLFQEDEELHRAMFAEPVSLLLVPHRRHSLEYVELGFVSFR